MLSDPIVALATPPGRGALALIRLSGRGAFDLAARVLQPFHAGARRARVVRAAPAPSPEPGADRRRARASASRARAPTPGRTWSRSRRMAGCSCRPRSWRRCVAAGARPAAPGEFTRRAVQNGKMDLLQAEATADLIDAGRAGAAAPRAAAARARPVAPARGAARRDPRARGADRLRHRFPRGRRRAGERGARARAPGARRAIGSRACSPRRPRASACTTGRSS